MKKRIIKIIRGWIESNEDNLKNGYYDIEGLANEIVMYLKGYVAKKVKACNRFYKEIIKELKGGKNEG